MHEGVTMNYRAVAEEFANSDVEAALKWLVQQGGETTEAPPGMNEYDRMDMGRLLVTRELIYKERSAAGEWTISSVGRKVAEELIAARKTNGWLRRDLIIREMLAWIDNEEPRNLSHFTGQIVDGVEVTERETSRAMNFLREHNLVKGVVVYDTIMEPTLTAGGIRVKDHSELPEKLLYQGGTVNNDHSNNVTVSHSNVGAVNAGDNAMQSGNSVSVTDSSEVLAQILEIDKALAELPDVPASVSTSLEELKEAASNPQPDNSLLRQAFGSFAGAVAAKFGEDPWGAVLKLTAGLSTLLGL
jgi:hypothetical protein